MKRLYLIGSVVSLISLEAVAQENSSKKFPKQGEYIKSLQEAYQKTKEKDYTRKGNDLWKALEHCTMRSPIHENICVIGILEVDRLVNSLQQMDSMCWTALDLMTIREEVLK